MELTVLEQIDILQRKIILHSYLYYELDDSVISDREYDAMSKQLVEYKNDHPDLWVKSEYYKQFGDDYNGATGFTLFHDLDEKQKQIIRVIASFRNKYRK